MPDLIDPKVEPIEDKDMDLWSCSRCQSVFHFAIKECPICFLISINKLVNTGTDFGPLLGVKSETPKPDETPDATRKDFIQYRLREISFHLSELLSLLFNLSGEKP